MPCHDARMQCDLDELTSLGSSTGRKILNEGTRRPLETAFPCGGRRAEAWIDFQERLRAWARSTSVYEPGTSSRNLRMMDVERKMAMATATSATCGKARMYAA